MFAIKEFLNITEASEHIKKILAEIESTKSFEFQIIHSLSETECTEEGGTWEEVAQLLPRYLLDLNDMSGFMVFSNSGGEECWDYIEWEDRDDELEIYRPKDEDEVYVSANEGLVVIHNTFSCCENTFPVVVVKKSFWDAKNHDIIMLLKNQDPRYDYTSKISPAIYVELFYGD